MNHYNRLWRIESILLQEEARRKRLAKRVPRKPELKSLFYKDILSTSFPGDPTVFEKLEKRRSALLKHGYIDGDGNVTEKGLDALIRAVIKVTRAKHN
jgi:hypothetical protein